MIPKPLLRCAGCRGDGAWVVAHAHELGNLVSQPVVVVDDGWCELHGPSLAIHVWRRQVPHVPVGPTIEPGVEAVGLEQLHDWLHTAPRDLMLLEHREMAVDQQTAIESGKRQLQLERLDQHRHASRWTAARYRKEHTGHLQLSNRCDGPLG